MSRLRHLLCRIGCRIGSVVVLALAIPSVARSQATITIDLPTTDPFPAAPAVHVSATGVNSPGPYKLRLRMSLDAGFGLIVYDVTLDGLDATFRTIKLLPENQSIFVEASVTDGSGKVVLTTSRLAGRTGPRLMLLSPDGSTNITVFTRQPRFSWRSAAVTTPPGPWVYELHVVNVATQETFIHSGILDSSYTLPDSLQAQTSYRWSVVAKLPNGLAADSGFASSQSSFVVFPTDEAPITLLYQNFPNPFPAPSSATTCIWFDLKTAGSVRLSVLDIRGHKVKTIIPGQLSDALTAGRYGRRQNGVSGCDPRSTWDGTADDGRVVPPGVYLLHMTVDGGPPMVKKMLFLGH
jgi:hypothetical protein